MAVDEHGRLINAYQDTCINYRPHANKTTGVKSIKLGRLFECLNEMIPKGEQKSCYYCMNHENDEHVEPMRISMKIENFIVTTSSGRFIESLDFLDYKQERELDQIGYSGEDYSGAKTDRETFLNSLGLGDFKVDQIGFDNGDFQEKFIITRVTK